MTIVSGLVTAILVIYFFLMSVRPRTAAESNLTRRLMFGGDVFRAAIAAAPVAVLQQELPLDNNKLITWMALFLIIEPLFLPPAIEPEAKDTQSLIRFLVKWLIGELDSFLKTSVVLGPLLLLGHWFPVLGKGPWLEKHYTFIQRLPESLDLPLAFYLVLLFMLIIKSWMLLALPKHGNAASNAGWLSGVFALIYFFNLTGQVHMEEWEYPTGGLLSSLFFKFWVKYYCAWLDWAAEGTGLRK